MEGMGKGAATYVRGGFLLFIGNVVSLFVMAAGSILVARMLSPSEYGLYGVALVLPELFLLFSDWGVNSALTRFIARYRSEEEYERILVLERVALLFKLSVGCVLSLALFLSADALSVVLLRRPEIGGLVKMASLLILSRSLHSTVISALAGLERMDLRAVVNVTEAVAKGIASPLLVYMGFGVSGPIIGYISSYIVASILGVFFMVVSSPNPGNVDVAYGDYRDSLGLMIGFGLPLFWGGLVVGFAGRIQGFLLSWFVSDEAFGNYHVAVNFTRLVGLVTGSLAVTLFPAFSRLSHSLEPGKTREAFQMSVRYSTMFVVPLICLLAAVSEPMVHVLYTTRYPQAPLLLSLFLVPTLFVGVGALSVGSFLNSQGDTGITLRVGLVGSAASILISPILVWIWGVFGLAVSLIASSVVGSVFGLYMLYKRYGFFPDLGHTVRTLMSSAIAASLAFGFVRLLSNVMPFLSLLLGSGVFFLVYLFLAPVIGVIEESDIGNLDSMLKGLVVVYPFARLLLEFERRILGITLRRKKNSARAQ